ncbi:enolase C-terminal domain-like protein [Roseibacterium sp. SDUM158017]|uniref:enolase C-terminal domain-like protein n=1 Tax=Roseicyclus salinarum TaxID=3036773 RepID=UPI0024151BF5|nr:enolase C-terminal domain-like protein [Roseibacterium sp. SDUM158017]MDG4649926.1 enolase C-terminal domain-like protein [Roseibacterium sp. SDUM158017]
MSARIIEVTTHDVRFPTSRLLDGSDAMNPTPDYSAAYVILRASDGSEGHGMTFTIGRGNEICCAAIEAVGDLLKGRDVDGLFADMGAAWRLVTGDSQLRWTGPEKGVIHLAAAAVMNALWDMYGKRAGKPVWRLICEMPPDEQVALVDWRYLADALPPAEARERLENKAAGRAARIAAMEAEGYPAYTTSAGWLGYSDDKIRALMREALAEGWTHFKMKVGASIEDDLRRAALIREEIGPDRFLMMDANQVWGVEEAIANMKRLAAYDPWWIEEPTSPDDILGHARIAREIAPVSVATGEHCHNAVMFKQLMQAGAIRFVQVDSCRLAGPNEILGVMLLAEKFGLPVCPHAGGVGLCELIQHMSFVDYVCVSASLEDRVLEYVDHLHEHFVDPVRTRNGRYLPPARPGFSVEMKPESIARHEFPDGAEWRGSAG